MAPGQAKPEEIRERCWQMFRELYGKQSKLQWAIVLGLLGVIATVATASFFIGSSLAQVKAQQEVVLKLLNNK